MRKTAQLYTLVFWSLATALIAQPKSMQDLVYPDDTKKVTLPSGIELAYIDRGEGPYTLLFLHGLGANLKAWQKNVDSLSQDFRCIALDLPGYGKSGKGDFAYGMAFFADEVRSFCETLDLQNLVLVGHSMGAQVALTLVLRDSSLPAKLILIAPAGIETFSSAEANWLKAVYTPEVVKNSSPEQIRRNFLLNFYQWPEDAEFMYADRMLLRETAEYEGWCRMVPQCVAGMLNEPVFEKLEQVRLPSLILFGENDALIPNTLLHKDLNTDQVATLAQEKIPNSQLVQLPECGHFVQWEQAQKTNEAIRKFLTD